MLTVSEEDVYIPQDNIKETARDNEGRRSEDAINEGAAGNYLRYGIRTVYCARGPLRSPGTKTPSFPANVRPS